MNPFAPALGLITPPTWAGAFKVYRPLGNEFIRAYSTRPPKWRPWALLTPAALEIRWARTNHWPLIGAA